MVKKQSQILRHDDSADGDDPHCDWPGCDQPGSHRAPRSRDELRSYRWFCLNHIRVYNKSWNYYAGMSDSEVEADLRRDTVWQRPSWPLGGKGHPRQQATLDDIIDDFGVFGDRTEPTAKAPPPSCLHAMKILDLNPPLTPEAVKARYKELVKLHHPDANGGDKASEEKFKEITAAYEIIMGDLTP